MYLRMDHTNNTIIQPYYWTNLRDDICTHIQFFRTVQKNIEIKKHKITTFIH